jgi:hypothetical protein
VSIDEKNVSLLHPPPPQALPTGRGLSIDGTLGGGVGLISQLRLRPSFFDHFDTAVLDWSYVEGRDEVALAVEAGWAVRQRLRLVVDFSSGANLYPTLRLCNNSAAQYEGSLVRMEAVLRKMATKVTSSSGGTPHRAEGAFSADAIISFHAAPENYYTAAQCLADFAAAGARLARTASSHGITLYVRVGAPNKPPANLVDALALHRAMGAPANVKLGVQLSTLLAMGTQLPLPGASLVGAWLLAARASDPYNAGGPLSYHAPLACMSDADSKAAAALLRSGPRAGISGQQPLLLLDASLPADSETSTHDAEYAEAEALEALMRGEAPKLSATGCSEL